MQPQNPYEPPREQQPPPTYPPQNYGQPQNYGYQQPYQQNYRPGQASAGAGDILMGVLLLILSLGAMGFGGLALLGAGMISSGNLPQNSSPALSNLPGTAVAAAGIVGGVFLVWGLLMLVSAIGIMRFKKWAMIMCGIMALVSTAYYIYSLVSGSSRYSAAGSAGSAAMVITIVFAGVSLLYAIYGFVRAGAAN